MGRCDDCEAVHQTVGMFLVDPPVGPSYYLCIVCWEMMRVGKRMVQLKQDARRERSEERTQVELATDE